MTLVVRKVNMFSKNNLLKLNLISCHDNIRELLISFYVVQDEMIGDLNGSKTEFTRGPGRGDTCHLSFLDETLPD